MLKNWKARRMLAALGGASILLGVGTTGPAFARELRAVLNGDNLSPAGDTDGWGRVAINIDGTLNRLCADIEVRSVGEVTEVSIMRAGGGPVVALQAPDDNDSNDCDSIGDELADQIQADPSSFYVIVKTRDFPEGALRGAIVPS
jgi:hypothetical protein